VDKGAALICAAAVVDQIALLSIRPVLLSVIALEVMVKVPGSVPLIA